MPQGSGALNGAMTGASLGAVAGPWGMAIGAVAGLALGIVQDDANAKATEKQLRGIATNTYTALFDLQRQHNLENMRTSQAIADYKNQGKLAVAQVNANYGANEVIGASADALRQAINYQEQQAEQSVWLNHTTSVDNFNNQVNSIITQSNNQITQAVNSDGQANLQQLGGLVSTGLQMYSKYKGSSDQGAGNSFLQQFNQDGQYSGGNQGFYGLSSFSTDNTSGTLLSQF